MRLSRLFTLTLLLTVLFCSFTLITPVRAEPQGFDLLVTRLDDPAPDGCNTGDCSLREAIIAANTTPGTQAISITLPGTIELTIQGPDEDQAATGDLDVVDDTYIQGQGAGITIVDANQLDRVFDFPAPPPTAAPNGMTGGLEAMTITGGSVVGEADVGGGGVRVGFGRDATLFGVVVRDNYGSSNGFGLGGGVGVDKGRLSIYNSAIISNTADNAAGIANYNGTLTVVNSTVSGNSTTGQTGGILNLGTEAGLTSTLTISDSTIAYNVQTKATEAGAGLDSTGFDISAVDATVANTIIANNTGSTQCFAGGDGQSMFTSVGYNLSGDSSCSFTAGTDLVNTDPLLSGLLAEDGTYYHALGTNSPALDSGASSGGEDQRGEPRPVDLPGIPNSTDGSDRGAIEMSAAPTAVALAHLSVMSDDGFTRGALSALALAALGIIIALRRK